VIGSNNSQIATLVERHTRYVMLAKVKSKDSETVINALIKQAHKLPRELYNEPPREFRRLSCLSQATMVDSSSCR
jgi:IS30 family transposase